MNTIHLAIFLPFIVAIFIPLLNKRFPRIHIGWFVFIVPMILFFTLVRFIPSIASGKTYSQVWQWIPTYDISFATYLDGLSLIFGLLITGIGTLVILYSIYYLSPKESLSHFYVYLLLFMGAMLGVVFSDNMMVMYLFWELTSISSFLLIAFWYHRKQSRYGAQKSLLITVGGGIAMLISFLMLYNITGTFSVRETIASIHLLVDHPLFIPAAILLLIGAFTKSAQFPFHIWLPDAMEAPTPVSAYLHSATMVKAGIYVVARFTPVFGGEGVWFWLVSGIGLLTLFWGAFQAIRQTDLKALLAYSTISQLGLVMSLFGIGSIALADGYAVQTVLFTQAAFAAIFHLINHSTFKGALFMIVGIVDLQMGTRDIRRLGGLMAIMPTSFTIALIGSFSMAGLPPFNGFLSKEMFFTSVLNVRQLDLFSLESWGTLFPVIAWVASIFTFVYAMIIVCKTFFGPYKGDKHVYKRIEPPIGMLISPIILGCAIIGIFFFPNMVGTYLIAPAMSSLFPNLERADLLFPISIWHGWNTEIFMTIGIVIIGSFLYKTFRYWSGIYRLFPTSLSLDALYHVTLSRLETGSKKVTNTYMTGHLRDYLVYIYLFFVMMSAWVIYETGAFSIDVSLDAPVAFYEWILVFVMVIAAISILFAKSRLTAILLNGVLGFSVAFFFVLFRAPDLALTQTIIETITTVLFLLCFYFLPDWKKEKTPRHKKNVNIFISISVGLVFIAIALSVRSGKMFSTIATYFEQADTLVGGKNIVNAILGDFRAFDTMLEVVVLFIAGIGVYTLIKFKQGKGDKGIEDK
ncbi:Na+/H+ antiporter subunit A [Virgibacillus soli]|uniref:Na+/H+ antiporter subunit A n=1 Tax=Paracerasibacillus soli TaxID=480284 RepID=UPI0035EA49DF